MGKPLFTAQQFISAIPRSGGIISTIARRVGADWHTTKKYIQNHPSIKAAYDAECESILDVAESVVFGNIGIAAKRVQIGELSDSSDAKWLLTKLGKGRGYADRQEITAELSWRDKLPPDVDANEVVRQFRAVMQQAAKQAQDKDASE